MSISPTDSDVAARPGRPALRVVPQPRRPRRRVVVIGGGIAGLSAAHFVASQGGGDVDVIVLEAGPDVGGKLTTATIAGVTVDAGAEAMQSTRPEAVSLARAVGLDRDIVHPEVFGASLWLRERLRRMPPTVMGVPTDLRALAAAQVLSKRTLFTLPLEFGRSATRFDNDVSVGAFVEFRLGREVVDTLVEPLLGGVYAGRADALSLEATVPMLFRELKGESSLLRAAQRTSRGGGRQAGARRGPIFAGIRGGVGRLPQAVAADLVAMGAQVRTDSRVRSIHRVDDCWRVIVNPVDRQDVIEAEEVILAVPPPHASELLSHICPPAANDLGLIDMSSMAVVTLAYPADAVAPMSGSGFLVPPSEGRTIKAANYATSKWDWIARAAGTRRRGDDGLVLIRASVGRMGEEQSIDRDDAELVGDVHNELAEAVGISAAPVDQLITRWRDAIPQYATGHVRRVERIRSVVAGIEGLEICGAAFDGVGVAAVIGSARTAARSVLERVEQASAQAGQA